MINRNRVRLSKLSLGLVIALAAAPAFAQNVSSSLGGRVTDAGGQPVTGAQVTIVHTESGTTSQATTGADGRYFSRGLRVGGPYTITITKDGKTEKREGVYLALNEIGSVDATLGGAVANIAAVEVVGATSVFSSNSMGAGTSVDQTTLRSLASINGNIQDYIRLDPRVAFTDRASGSLSAGGMNPRFNKITIDGISASDTFGLEANNMPTQRQPVSLEAIEALDISLSNYDATISGAAGANVNAVTKSGTNQFHGSVYATYRDGDWVGDYQTNIAGGLNTTDQPFDEFSKEETWGFTFGGPLVQDKLFFFLNYEKYKMSDTSPAGFTTVSNPASLAANSYDATDLQKVVDIARDVWGFDAGSTLLGDTELEEYAIKFDWNINADHRASFRYSKLDQSRVRPETSNVSSGGTGTNSLVLSSSWYTHEKSVESYVGQLFSNWSDNFSTEFKVSYRDYDAVRVNPTTAPLITVFFGSTSSASDTIRLGTEFNSPGNLSRTKAWNYFGSGTWTVGDHDIKFGLEYSDTEVYNYFLQAGWGSYSFLVTGTKGAYNYGNLTNGIYFDYDLNYQASPGSVPYTYDSRSLGLFVQDTWYVNSNLTLTFGLRADKPSASPDPTYNAAFAAPQTTNMSGAWTGGFGIDNTNTYNGNFIIQPRFGFNYTFDSDRPTQLRGGIGLFQGDAPQVWIGNVYQATGLNYISWSNLVCVDANVDGHCDNGVDFTSDGLNPSVPPTQAGANRNVNVVSDDFELPSVWKANLALEHELPWFGIVASAEVLLSQVENGLFYRSLNIGPGFTGPDGRKLYWNPSQANFSSSRYNRNSTYGDVYLLDNTGKGHSRQFTMSLTKPFKGDSDWSWSLAYTFTDAEEVGSLTSSTAGSGYGSQLSFNVDDDVAHTARYEIRDRFSGTLNWKHSFFGDYETQIGLVYEGRSGRPFSYIFTGDGNGDGRTFNDLFYVPAGPGDVLFGSLNSSGTYFACSALNSAGTACATGSVSAAQMEADFNAWLDSQPGLKRYAGKAAPQNGFRAGWVNTFDLRISQELPGFAEGHKFKVWVDVQNIGNLINEDWGQIEDWGFNANNAVASVRGIKNGKYVYGYRSGTEFGQASAFGLPTNSDSQTNGVSQWSVQVGVKYEF